MEYLILQGVPKRTAHEVIGHLVGLCEQKGAVAWSICPILNSARPTPNLGPGVKSVLGVANAIKAFRSQGSTAPDQVEKQLAAWKNRLLPSSGT